MIVGVQGIFWSEKTTQPKDLWIDWRPEVPLLCVGSKSISISRTPPWFLLDVLLENLGQPVTYAEIATSGHVIDQVRSKRERDYVQKQKQFLTTDLKTALDEIGDGLTFTINPDRDEGGYVMKLFKPPSAPQA